MLKVSIIIIIRDKDNLSFLSECLQSLWNQTYKNWELLILDDASADNTAAVVAGIRGDDHRVIYSPSP